MTIRVVIDTNLWISYLLTRSFTFLDELIRKNKIKILYDQKLLNEIIQVANRPKLTKYITSSELKDLISTIDAYGEMVNVGSQLNLSRDKKDDFLLSLAFYGKADFLISGDEDLLVLNKIGSTKIIKITEFARIWQM